LSQTLRKDLLSNTVLNVLTKAISYCSYAVIAYIWGAKLMTDIYYVGISYVTAVSGIFIIIISSIFPTIFIKIRLNNSLIEARKFAGTFILFIIVPVFLISFFGFFYSTAIFSIVTKFNVEQIKNNNSTLSIFSIVILMTVVIEFYKSYLQSLGHFTIVASGYLVQSITFLLILFSSKTILVTNALIISLISSMILQIIIINFYIIKKNIWPLISFKVTSIHKSMISVAFPLFIAHSLTLFVNFFIVYLVSGYPSGFVTMYNYGQLISFLPGLLFFTPLLEVITVRLSELYHTDLTKMVDKLIDFQSVIILILVPFMCFFIYNRYDITKVFFFRGSFSIENVIQTSNILLIYSMIIVSTALVQIISRVYYIMQKTFMTSIFAIMFQLFTLISSFLLSKYFGFWGLPIGKVFVDILIVMPISFWLLKKYLIAFNIKIIVFDFMKILILCLILIFISNLIVNNIFIKLFSTTSNNLSFLFTILKISISSILFTFLYFYSLIYIKNKHALNLYIFIKYFFLSIKGLNKSNE